MNKDDIKKYNKINQEVLTTSEVIKNSFCDVLTLVKENEYVLINNLRHKQTLVVQDMKKFVGIDQNEIVKKVDVAKTKDDLILLAKQYIKENIFFLMKFESKNITFPQIESILDNHDKAITKGKFEATVTKQLMSGWKYALGSLKPFDVDEMIVIQGIVAKEQALEWGTLRRGSVTISGTDYKPPLPKKKYYTQLFEEFKKSKNKRLAASMLLAKMTKSQPFWDGNKRTTFISVNKLLIEAKVGILIIPASELDKFNLLLNNYYNDEQEINKLTAFLMKNIFNTADRKFKERSKNETNR